MVTILLIQLGCNTLCEYFGETGVQKGSALVPL